jgi:hypothetical protein
MSDNPFIEDRAIRAAIEAAQGNEYAEREMSEVLDEFLDGELRRLHHGAHHLAVACEAEMERRRNRDSE